MKEKNQVRMRGVLPSQGADPIPVGKIPDGGTQVVNSNSVSANYANIHTVGTGKTLYASQMVLSVRNISEVAAYGRLQVDNGSDEMQYILAVLQTLAGDGFAIPISFMPPLEIPTGWKVTIYSSAADIWVYGFIHGYEA